MQKTDNRANVIETVRVWLELQGIAFYAALLVIIASALGIGWALHEAHLTQQFYDVLAIIGTVLVLREAVGALRRMK